MRCRHCWVRVVGIPQEDSEGKPLTVAGKGDPPNWKHDRSDPDYHARCARFSLRDIDIENDPDADT